MIEAWRQVEDPQLRAILKETEGIGTEATRKDVVVNMKDRGFISLGKGSVVTVTDGGMALYNTLLKYAPKLLDVGMTAELEHMLNSIKSGEAKAADAICAAEELHQREAEAQSKRISEREREALKAVREAMARMEQNRAGKVSEMRHGTFTPNSIDWADMTPLLMRRLLLEHPKTVIGAICGVSEAAVRKYCAKHEIRPPPRG